MTPDTKMANRPDPQAEKTEKIEQRPAVAPPVDVFENENELLVVADLPGVAQDQMSIHFDKGRLTIEGRVRQPSKAWTARHTETPPADYRRTFLVPQGIDAEHISAELAQGVLTVHLPKHASLKPRKIQVQAG
ncbi:MAG: Hsp20/alpha crystallin family protein [Polyangiaceae bacterium]